MKRVRHKLKQTTKVLEKYVVKMEGADDIYYINCLEFRRNKPHKISHIAAMQLKAGLEKIYHGKFYIEKI